MDFVASLIVMGDAHFVFLVIVSNGLAAVLQSPHVPVDLLVLPENHFHSKGQSTRIVGQVQQACGPHCSCTDLDEMVYILVPIINGIDGST